MPSIVNIPRFIRTLSPQIPVCTPSPKGEQIFLSKFENLHPQGQEFVDNGFRFKTNYSTILSRHNNVLPFDQYVEQLKTEYGEDNILIADAYYEGPGGQSTLLPNNKSIWIRDTFPDLVITTNVVGQEPGQLNAFPLSFVQYKQLSGSHFSTIDLEKLTINNCLRAKELHEEGYKYIGTYTSDPKYLDLYVNQLKKNSDVIDVQTATAYMVNGTEDPAKKSIWIQKLNDIKFFTVDSTE